MKKLIIGFVVVLLLALVPSAAYAAETVPTDVQSIMQDLEASDDPELAFSQLTPAQQQAIRDSIRDNVTISEPIETVVQTGLPDDVLADGPSCGCATQTKYVNIRWLGELAGRYYSETEWCWDGDAILGDPYFNAWGVTYAWYLSFTGQTTNETGGDGDWKHKDFAQGRFEACGPILGCWSYWHPVIRKTQYGNGNSS